MLACPVACRLAHPPPLNTKQLVQPLRRPWDVGKKGRPYITWRYNGDSNNDDKFKTLGFHLSLLANLRLSYSDVLDYFL